MDDLEQLEQQLDSFSREEREAAFRVLVDNMNNSEISIPSLPFRMNLHIHTFFSFNVLGYSPLHVIWRARKEGLGMAGSVDFDRLDAVEEFLWGGLEVNLPVVSGLETRIFLPEFRTEELSSPREPGVAYYMGNGFTRLPREERAAARILDLLRETAQSRNRKVIEKLNAFMGPAGLDIERDIIPLTPSGNVMERHIIQALIHRVESVFPDHRERVGFWSDKLTTGGKHIEQIIDDQPNLADLVRMKLVKHGGVAYVEPGEGDFPRIDTVNAMIEELGAIPSFSWLDGTSSGERDPERLLEFCRNYEIETLFMVPDRNWNIHDETERQHKVANFYRMVQTARDEHMPIFVGTELNKFGQKFIDEFDSPSLAPLAPHFFMSAWVLWGHTVLEIASRRGYGSDWAKTHFQSRAEKNRFYASIGESTPANRESIRRFGQLDTAQLIKRSR